MNQPPFDDRETGPPIAELKEQEWEPSADFMARVRNKIHRRSTVSQVATFSWFMPKAVLIEMATLFGFLAKSIANPKDKQS